MAVVVVVSLPTLIAVASTRLLRLQPTTTVPYLFSWGDLTVSSICQHMVWYREGVGSCSCSGSGSGSGTVDGIGMDDGSGIDTDASPDSPDGIFQT